MQKAVSPEKGPQTQSPLTYEQALFIVEDNQDVVNSILLAVILKKQTLLAEGKPVPTDEVGTGKMIVDIILESDFLDDYVENVPRDNLVVLISTFASEANKKLKRLRSESDFQVEILAALPEEFNDPENVERVNQLVFVANNLVLSSTTEDFKEKLNIAKAHFSDEELSSRTLLRLSRILSERAEQFREFGINILPSEETVILLPDLTQAFLKIGTSQDGENANTGTQPDSVEKVRLLESELDSVKLSLKEARIARLEKVVGIDFLDIFPWATDNMKLTLKQHLLFCNNKQQAETLDRASDLSYATDPVDIDESISLVGTFFNKNEPNYQVVITRLMNMFRTILESDQDLYLSVVYSNMDFQVSKKFALFKKSVVNYEAKDISTNFAKFVEINGGIASLLFESTIKNMFEKIRKVLEGQLTGRGYFNNEFHEIFSSEKLSKEARMFFLINFVFSKISLNLNASFSEARESALNTVYPPWEDDEDLLSLGSQGHQSEKDMYGNEHWATRGEFILAKILDDGLKSLGVLLLDTSGESSIRGYTNFSKHKYDSLPKEIRIKTMIWDFINNAHTQVLLNEARSAYSKERRAKARFNGTIVGKIKGWVYPHETKETLEEYQDFVRSTSIRVVEKIFKEFLEKYFICSSVEISQAWIDVKT